jgi:hypothetical protein
MSSIFSSNTVGLLNRKRAEYGAINLEDEIEPRQVEAFAQGKSDLQDDIMRLQAEVAELKAQRQATRRHITYRELPEAARFNRLSTQRAIICPTLSR